MRGDMPLPFPHDMGAVAEDTDCSIYGPACWYNLDIMTKRYSKEASVFVIHLHTSAAEFPGDETQNPGLQVRIRYRKVSLLMRSKKVRTYLDGCIPPRHAP